MKRAFFVIGPESSGTRMMTRAFIKCGCYGSGGHLQALDEEGFKGGHEMIVFRRSVPHGKFMPNVNRLVARMQKNDYQIFPIVILRDKDACAASQVKNKHAKTLEQAKSSIEEAVDHIYSEWSALGMHPTIVHYEPFVRSQAVREAFFATFGFKPPEMEFYDGNEQYKENAVAD